jgi:hypothetical protein
VRRFAAALLVVAVAALLVAAVPTRAAALPLVAAPRVVMLGDSITWQVCTDRLQQYPPEAPQYLRDRDGGCYGFSGATMEEMAWMVQGGRFYSPDAGQPHPYFPNRGQTDPYSVREAIDRADVLVLGLGTNDAGRLGGTVCQDRTVSPWPVQIPAPGVGAPPCVQTPERLRQTVDYFAWLAQGKPLFWIDVAVTSTTDAAYAHQQQVNEVIWAAAARHPNLHPVAWSEAVAGHPGEWLRGDGVHLSTPAGNAGRYSTILAALRGCGYR